MNDNQTLMLFAEDENHAARIQAVDQLHAATNVYTADPVIDQLLTHMDWPNGPGRFIDPSCGDGAVVGRALTKALTARAFDDANLAHHLQGWELHPFACAQARARLASILISFGRSAAAAERLAGQIVHNKDFLTESPNVPQFHVLCGNPPYLRRANIPALLRDEYDQHVPKYAAGDMMHAFLDRCLRTMHQGGQIGVVVSDRVLLNNTAADLREKLGEKLGIDHVERLDSESSFYRPKERRKGTPARVHPLLLVMSETGDMPLSKDPVYPGVDDSKYAGVPTLADLAQVRIGAYLGTAGVFLVTPEEAKASNLPAEVLVRAIDLDDIKAMDGDKLGPPKHYAIRTHPDVQPCDAVMKHLKKTMPMMAQRGLKGSFWCPPETFHRRSLAETTLMVPRIAQTPRAIWLPPGTLAVNHNVSIVSGDMTMLTRIERALRSDFAAQWLREHAPRIEGGYYTLNTTLLRKMPMKLD
jgi:hypothetical protein